MDIAVIGAGRIGRIHARNVFDHPLLRLHSIVDPVGDNAQTLAQELGASVSTFDSVLSDPSVKGIVIASPTDQHLEQTLGPAHSDVALDEPLLDLCEQGLELELSPKPGADPPAELLARLAQAISKTLARADPAGWARAVALDERREAEFRANGSLEPDA